MSASAVVLFLGFWLGAEKGLPPQIVGFLCGGSVGTFWANIDTISLMAGESTPTDPAALGAALYAADDDGKLENQSECWMSGNVVILLEKDDNEANVTLADLTAAF